MDEAEAQKIYELVAKILNRKQLMAESREAFYKLMEMYKLAPKGKKDEIFEKVIHCLTRIQFDVIIK